LAQAILAQGPTGAVGPANCGPAMAGPSPRTRARAKTQPLVAACLALAALTCGASEADRRKAARFLLKASATKTRRGQTLELEWESSPLLNASNAGNASGEDTFRVDSSPDPRKTWSCLEVRPSKIKGAGRGLFATCDLPSRTLLGEYRGKRFELPEFRAPRWSDPGAHELEADRAYIWKVPKCKAPLAALKVITRVDEEAAHRCSDLNGFVYVDAFPLDEPKENPMRFVNGVQWLRDQKAPSGPQQENVDAFFSDDRVWYYTKTAVATDQELIVDYGKSYWADSSDAHSRDDFESDSDWPGF